MKKIFLLAIAFVLSYSVQSQEVSEDQYTILTKKTADWCPKCGDWGWDFFNQAIETQGNKKVIIWAVHHSGGLATDVSEAIADNFPVPGQPVFFLDSDDLDVTSSNVAEKVGEIDYLIDAITTFEPSESVGAEVIVGTEDVSVKQKVRFNIDRNVVGDFFLASYILDQDLIAYQSNQGQDANHKNILLGEVTGKPFGEAIPDGTYAPGEELVIESTVSLEEFPYGTEGLSLVTILWTTDNGRYYFINGNVQTVTDGTTVSVIETIAEEKLILSNVSDSGLTFEIENKEFIGEAKVNLIGSTGQVITSQSMTINSGVQNNLNYPSLASGIYILNIQSKNKRVTKRFFLN